MAISRGGRTDPINENSSRWRDVELVTELGGNTVLQLLASEARRHNLLI